MVNEKLRKIGLICIKCGNCCKNIEMEITLDEILLIEKSGFNRVNFIQKKNGYTFLKNVDRQCFFLSDNKCKIYEIRPKGCRFYPIILYEDKNKCIIDSDCSSFEINYRKKIPKEVCDEIKKYIKLLDRESNERTI